MVEDLIDPGGGHDQIGEEVSAILLARVDAALGGGETSATTTTASPSFNLSGASSTSGTTLLATFSEAPASGATTLSNYCVTITSVSSFSDCTTSPGVLAVSGTPSQSGSQVTVTTATQTASVYVLWVQNLTSSDGSVLSISSASFIGTGAAAFNVTGATSGSSSSVRVNFSSVPDTNHTVLGNYCVSTVNHVSFAACDADAGNKLTISGTPTLSSSQITITSAAQSTVTYYVWVQNVMSGGLGLTVAQASFTGQTPTPFNVDSANGVSSTVATVTYSEAPVQAQAETTTNYCLTVNIVADYATCAGGSTLSVSAASLSGSTVTLTTATQTGVTYYVWVQNVTSNANGTAMTTDNTNFSGTAPGPLTGLVINEIVFSSSSDWFVEIYNGSGASIDLGTNGARLRRDSNCSLPSITSSITLSGTIANGAYYTVGRGAFSGGADLSNSSVSLNDDDCVAITDDASSITASNASNVIDFVGFGAAAAYEGSSAAVGWRNLARCANGTDTDVNGNDLTGRSDAQRTQGTANNCTAATAFNVNSATSNSSSQIAVTFSEAPYQSYAEVQGNYCVTSNTSNSTFAECTADTGNLLALSGTPSLTGSVVTITTAAQSATNYEVFVQNVLSDTGGTKLTTDNAAFTGTAPVVNATLVINEVATDESSSADLIELYVTVAGNLSGLTLYERGTLMKTLPNVAVSAGDYIVLHLNATGTDETVSITQSGDAGNYTTAWDYWDNTTGGLTGTDGTVTLRDSSGTTILDALVYANNNASWTGDSPDTTTAIVAASQWDAGGLESDAVNQDEGAGNSYQNRINGSASNNDAASWRVATSSFGAANQITGSITLDGTAYYTTGATAIVTVTDGDLNTNTGSAQTVNITATSTSDGTGISLTLTETGVNTGVFTSTATGSDLAFCNTGSCSSSPTLEVSDGDTVTVTYSDAAPAGARTDTATWNVSAPANNTATHLVISEVCYDACNTTGADDEYIEIYNPTASPIDLNAGGYRIYRDTSAGGAPSSFVCSFATASHFNGGTLPTSTVVPARGFYLVVNDNAPAGLTALADARVLDSRMTLTANNIIYLGTNTISNASDPDIVDFVGIGTAVENEGAGAAPAIASGQSIERKAYVSSTGDTNATTGMFTGGGHVSNGNGEDANNNSADFVLRTAPEPQNRASSTETP